MLSTCREDDQLVETLHLPIHPAKAKELVNLLNGLIASMHKASSELREACTHAPAPGSNEYLICEVWNGPTGLRQWWESTLLVEFQAALRERQLLTGMPDLHFQPCLPNDTSEDQP